MTRDLKRLKALLAQEGAALIRGDRATLDRLGPRKAALLTRIEEGGTPVDAGLAQQVRTAAQRNARLFEAAIEGIRDARALILRAREGGRGQTYGRDGVRAALEPREGSVQRRA